MTAATPPHSPRSSSPRTACHCTTSTRPATRQHDTGVCGAALYLSAAAGAHLAGAPGAAPEPAPTLPDLAVVVYDHRPTRATPPGAPASPWWLGEWTESWTPRQHADAVDQVRAAIGRGDVYQTNLVGHAAARYAGDPLPALSRLGALPGARYGGVLTGDGWAIGCASPETLIEVTDGHLITRPIKGTRPATATGRAELLASAKERAEHVMIVDLERNDLARIARTGTVTVDDLFTVRRWCDLWQAESTVRAAAADGLGLADLLRATCPGGSVTGAPELAALDPDRRPRTGRARRQHGRAGLGRPGPRRPGPDHPHRRRRRPAPAHLGRRRHHLGQRRVTPRSPRPPRRQPRSAPPWPGGDRHRHRRYAEPT